jgi:MFS family permease
VAKRRSAARSGGQGSAAGSTNFRAMAAAVFRYYQVRSGGPATRLRWRRIGLIAAGIVLATVVAITVAGAITGNPWWGPIAALAIAVVLVSAGLLAILRALKEIRVIGTWTAAGPPPARRPPLNRRQARPGVMSREERERIEFLERLYLHRKAVVDRSPNADHRREAQAWSEMIDAKLKLGLCGWPGCRNRDWAYSFCAEHDPRRTGGQTTVV